MRARRRRVVDEYVADGQAAVYSEDGVVVLLSELATKAWLMLGNEWVADDDVTAELVGEFGEPPEGGAERLTGDALRSLAQLHIVELEEHAPA